MNEVPAKPHVMVTTKGHAEVILTDGQNVTLRAPFVSPPGSPLTGMLLGTDHPLQIKVHGCRRVSHAETENAAPPSGEPPQQSIQFEITGRWVNLSRDARLALLG